MNSWIKYGLLLVVGFFALRWVSGFLSSALTPSNNNAGSDGTIVQAPYAAPLVPPSPIYAWAPPQYGYGYDGSFDGGSWDPWSGLPWFNVHPSGHGPYDSYFPTGYGGPTRDGYRNGDY